MSNFCLTGCNQVITFLKISYPSFAVESSHNFLLQILGDKERQKLTQQRQLSAHPLFREVTKPISGRPLLRKLKTDNLPRHPFKSPLKNQKIAISDHSRPLSLLLPPPKKTVETLLYTLIMLPNHRAISHAKTLSISSNIKQKQNKYY